MLKIERKVRIVIMLILTSYGIIPFASSQTNGCSIFRKGVFHVYLTKDGKHYIVYRDDQTEKEVVDGSTDTLVWHIDWKDDCDYTVQYLSNTGGLTGAQQKFLKKHKLFYHLQPGDKEYCVYTETVDKIGGPLVEKDTMWLHEVAYPISAPLAVLVKSESLLRNRHFSDTSLYAVVYIYRPKKMMLSVSSYDMYLENNLLCTMKNNSSYIFAVFRQGAVNLWSRCLKDTCYLRLNIQPGKSYYVRSTIDFGMFGLKNFKLKMELVPAAEGKEEFDRTFR
jgi:hypothetical protein